MVMCGVAWMIVKSPEHSRRSLVKVPGVLWLNGPNSNPHYQTFVYRSSVCCRPCCLQGETEFKGQIRFFCTQHSESKRKVFSGHLASESWEWRHIRTHLFSRSRKSKWFIRGINQLGSGGCSFKCPSRKVDMEIVQTILFNLYLCECHVLLCAKL